MTGKQDDEWRDGDEQAQSESRSNLSMTGKEGFLNAATMKAWWQMESKSILPHDSYCIKQAVAVSLLTSIAVGLSTFLLTSRVRSSYFLAGCTGPFVGYLSGHFCIKRQFEQRALKRQVRSITSPQQRD